MLRKQARENKRIREVATGRELARSGTDLQEIPELLNVLAQGDRDVLVLRVVHGLRFHDVAAALGISEEAAKKRAQRALRRLRNRIHDSDGSQGTLPIAL
jgi:DNA-directed RNA polymerase specialized sigma24 family protein